jgi:hypothetical protein
MALLPFPPRAVQDRELIPLQTVDRVLVYGAAVVVSVVAYVLGQWNGVEGIDILCLSCAVTLLLHARGITWFGASAGWLHPAVFFLSYSALALGRMLIAMALGYAENDGLLLDTPGDVTAVAALYSALVAFALVSYAAGHKLAPESGQGWTLSWHPRDGAGARALALCVALAVATLAYVASLGGPAAALARLAYGRSNLINEGELSGEWVLVARLILLTGAVWLAVAQSVAERVAAVAAGILGGGLEYLLSGSRSAFFLGLLVLVCVLAWERGVLPKAAVAGVVLAAVAALSLLGDVRRESWKGDVDFLAVGDAWDSSTALDAGLEEAISRSSRLNPALPILVRVPTEVPLLWGRSYVALFTFAVPRAIWPEKPRSTGAQVGEIFLGTPAPVPPGAVAEAFWNFHLPGVAVVFLLFGVFHRSFAALALRSRSVGVSGPLVAVTLIELQGPDVLTVLRWGYSVCLLWLVAWWVGFSPAGIRRVS